MFGKKKKQPKNLQKNAESAKELTSAKVQVMPDVFYGGKDPVIFESRTKQTSRSTSKSTPLPSTVKKTSAPVRTSSARPPQKPPTSPTHSRSKKWVLILMLILFGVIIGGIVWWFTRLSPETTVPPTTTIPLTEQEPISPTTTVPVPPLATTTPTTTESEPTIPEIGGITFPQIVSVDSVDVDEDSLTDEEERVFGTDPTVWDSDEDSYYDGLEIANLYNPRGEAPVRLIDSGLVRDFTNPQWRYRVFYPINWEIGRVDTEGRQVLFSTITGEFVELRVFEKSPGISFQQWFGQTISGQPFSDIESMTNRFDIEGYIRRDSLVAYFPTETEVVVMVYNVPETITEIRYRNIMKMMVQSFRPGNVSNADIMSPSPEPLVEGISDTAQSVSNTPSTSESEATTTLEETTESSPENEPVQTTPGSGIPGIDPNL